MRLHSVAVADDHNLIRSGLVELINTFPGYQVIFQAKDGNQVIGEINAGKRPDIVLLDINMPEKDGFETALWLKENHPAIKVIALSMHEKETAVIRMLRNGVKGYILKVADPRLLQEAFDAVIHKGYHYSDLLTGHLLHSIQKDERKVHKVWELTEREMLFLKLACSELTYKQIAAKMFVSPRTVDGYRDALFQKLNVMTRVGLVLYAIRNGVVELEESYNGAG
jgi:two-component system, NarL family, invasion response regulator UvrY